MSLQFSDTTNRRGVIELIDDILGTDSTQYSTAKKTRDVNLALDRAFALIFSAGGTWQFDDSNQTDYPIITTNIVSGQRDYSFTTDANNNLILEVFRVLVSDENGNFNDILPVDVSSKYAPVGFTDGNNTGGLPNSYDKLGNGIFLDPIPNYNRTGGLKVYINREASYFTTTDTTKKAGFAGLFHEYLALLPAYKYARDNAMSIANSLKNDVAEMENAIIDYYKSREKDTRKVFIPRVNNAR